MAKRPIAVFRTKALSVAGVSALLGDRMYANTAVPEKTAFPYVEVKLEKSEHPHHMGGASGWAMCDIVATIYAYSNDVCGTVADALRVGMHPFKGSVTVSGDAVQVGYLGLESESEVPEALQDGAQRPVYAIKQNWQACIAES
jgi:hypothetical protein